MSDIYSEIATRILAQMRSEGWTVAVHNDYELDRKPMTFWLFTHPSGVWAKGEGWTDYDALLCAQSQADQRMRHKRDGVSIDDLMEAHTKMLCDMIARWKSRGS